MDGPHKQEFHVRNLLTRSVTLFPTQAQVVREIKDVVLKPGANEITVVGVTPTADENSIKVEGTGLATITDITVELLPNRDIFEEIYPDSDSEPDKNESEEEEEEDDSEDKVNAALEEVKDKLVALQDEQKRAKEIIASAESRLRILDSYCNSLNRKADIDIEARVETYRKERQKVFRDHMEGAVLDRDLTKSVSKLMREKARLEKLQAREEKKAAEEKAKAKRAREKRKAQQKRRDEEREREKDRIRRERRKFWPRVCYTVRISLDAGTNFTPSSSRRNSIASAADVELASDKSPKEGQATVTCDLTLSYVTSSAFWSPSYDLALSTTTNTATLSFDARLTNMTSETWTNSKVILSTSQANFSGLQDDVPSLVPWRLKLVGRGIGLSDGFDIVYSREERNQKEIWTSRQNAAVSQRPRTDLFGVGQGPLSKLRKEVRASSSVSAPPPPPPPDPSYDAYKARAVRFGMSADGPGASAFNSSNTGANNTVSAFGQVGANANNFPGGSLFGLQAPPAAPPAAPAPGAATVSRAPVLFAARRSPDRAATSAATQPEGYSEDTDGADNDDAGTMLEPAPELSFQDPSFEETGLTATYELPQAKTLKPSPTPSKQRIARVSFANVSFSRTVVAKYRPAAYLRARLRNTSKLTLLRGPMGLTLDGTFLGRSTLPRCSAGDSFTVALGVDPAIRVAYPKPDVTRSTTGVFSKGENNVYTRSVTLVNTRAAAGRPVDVTVLDQVPVSEDDKIRVEVLRPAGLAASGGKTGPVPTGVPGREGKEEQDWGKATASLKKAGEVQWDVSLNAGKSVKLVLQYEVAFPTGERVAQVF
ncbi:hypothetical protein MYCTH_97470 [Thermothelomyces thermophilus ATCC 42464]|uniref:DUF4139 domain-containing protein n=1 Tax=Thermothelomyces thermophilus (strain ATCC 42464 / BCRC 31852 / DSM 1799) TaxID=573729 RepID=G2Q678_THET4|nr:uncharacterized protein MYCTH_97470 [Thermothelomyces thermophilus ATCC 42464]AEO55557.1 hypothetical protein MYCTH_97470 [Thermothelomyces thermophilus ATCC 42464]